MPFGGYFDTYYTDVIRPAIAATGLEVTRADEIYSTGIIVDDIFRAIIASELCIADVTGRNPNVSYELGVAHASRKPVILITQDIKDVPFDYQHLRIITYDPKAFGWERAFVTRIQNTVAEVRKQPSVHIALTAVSDDRDTLFKHVREIFYAADYDLARTNWIHASADGTALIATSWRFEAKSQVFHLCHNIVLDKPGIIDVLSVRDKIEARDLDWVIVSRDSMHLSYFILFKQFKRPGQHCEVLTEVRAQNFFDFPSLFRTGEAMMSTQAVAGGIRYTRRVDNLLLPRTAEFARVYAQYQSHPNSSRIGERVNVEAEDDHYLLRMVYDAGFPYQISTAAFLRTT
jgi:hypothetical protein